MRIRTVIFGIAVVAVSFIGATLVMNRLWPVAPKTTRPALVALPPLQPLTGNSMVLAPAAVALAAIRDALEAQAPKNLSGKPQNPASKLLANAQFKFDVARGPLSVNPATLRCAG